MSETLSPPAPAESSSEKSAPAPAPAEATKDKSSPESSSSGLDVSTDKEKSHTDDEPLRVVLTSLDKSAEAFAREAAHDKKSKNPEGPAWKRVVKSAWDNMTHDYQVVKEKQKAQEEIFESGNLLHHHGESDEAWRESTVRRYASEYGEEMLRDGETFFKLGEGETAESDKANQIRQDVLGLVRNYANGSVADEASLNAERERLMQDWKANGISQDFIGEGRLLADNMTSMAKQVKGMYDGLTGLGATERSDKLDEILARVQVVAGEAKAGSETEIEATVAERLAQKLKNVPFLSEGRLGKVAAVVGNETVIAGMMSVATYGATRAASMVATGVGGAAVAGLRERRALKDERALAERRREMGAETTEMPDTSGDSTARNLLRKAGIGVSEQQRRAEMDATLYSSRPVDEVIGEMSSLYGPDGTLNVLSPEDLKGALNVLGEAKARAQRKLLSVQSVEVSQKEQRKYDAFAAASKLEADLRGLYENDAARVVLGVKEDEAEAAIQDALSTANGMLDVDVEAKDRIARKLAFTRIMQRTMLGATAGVGIGAAVHGAEHLVGSAFASDSVSEHAPTGLDGSSGHVSDSLTGNAGVGTGDTISQHLSDHSTLNMPDGYHTEVSDGSMTLTTPHGGTIEGLQVNKDGSLTAAAQQTLREHGLKISDHVGIVQGTPEVTHHTVNANQFVKNHSEQMTTIGHREWLNGPDQFQLQNHVNADGSVTISVQGMDSDNWKAAAESGHLNAYLSASRGSSGHGFKIPIGPDGTAKIGADDPMRAMFDSGGHYQAGFEEAAITGHTVNGADHIAVLATAVGGNKESFTDTFTTQHPIANHTYTITENAGGNAGGDATVFTETPTSGYDFGTPIVAATPRTGIGQPENTVTPEPAAPEPEPAEALGFVPPEPAPEPEPEAEPTAETTSESETTETKTETEPEAEPEAGPAPDSSADDEAPAPEPEPEPAETPGLAPPEPEVESTSETEPEPEPEPTPEPEPEASEPESSADKEKKFFSDLDAEDLDLPDGGYDPKDWSSLGMRERKHAVRFMREAMAAVDDPTDKTKVIEEAIRLATDAQTGATGEMAKHLKDTLSVLNKSATRIESDSGKGLGVPDAKEFLDDLDSESRRLQFTWLTDKRGRPAANIDGLDDRTKKLITRVMSEASRETLAETKLTAPPTRPPSFKAGEADHDKLDKERADYNDFFGSLLRKVTTIAHTDRLGDLSTADQQMFSEAVKYAGQIRRSYKVARS